MPKVFHCPVSMVQKHGSLLKRFSTLSGLVQHLESGACEGGIATYREMAERIQSYLANMGHRSLHLLL